MFRLLLMFTLVALLSVRVCSQCVSNYRSILSITESTCRPSEVTTKIGFQGFFRIKVPQTCAVLRPYDLKTEPTHPKNSYVVVQGYGKDFTLLYFFNGINEPYNEIFYNLEPGQQIRYFIFASTNVFNATILTNTSVLTDMSLWMKTLGLCDYKHVILFVRSTVTTVTPSSCSFLVNNRCNASSELVVKTSVVIECNTILDITNHTKENPFKVEASWQKRPGIVLLIEMVTNGMCRVYWIRGVRDYPKEYLPYWPPYVKEGEKKNLAFFYLNIDPYSEINLNFNFHEVNCQYLYNKFQCAEVLSSIYFAVKRQENPRTTNLWATRKPNTVMVRTTTPTGKVVSLEADKTVSKITFFSVVTRRYVFEMISVF